MSLKKIIKRYIFGLLGLAFVGAVISVILSSEVLSIFNNVFLMMEK